MRKTAAVRGVGEMDECDFRVKNRAVRLREVMTADVGVCWRGGGDDGRAAEGGHMTLLGVRLSPRGV